MHHHREPRACTTTATLAAAVDLFDGSAIPDDNQAAIATLRQASRCEDIGAIGATSPLDVWRIAKLAIVDARARAERGEPEEALEQILDVWSVGLDLSQAGGLLEVHVGAAITNTGSDAILDLLNAAEIDAGAIAAAQARIEGFQARPTNFDAATARDTRAYWAHLSEQPRAILSYARWHASRRFAFPALLDDADAIAGPELSGPQGILQAAVRNRREADARTQVVAAALARS